MHACSVDPFQILNKLNDNIYVIDFGISSTLNVNDLMDCKGLDFILLFGEPSLEHTFESPLPQLQDILPNRADKVDKILDDEIITTSDGGTRRYLVRRKGSTD